MNEVEIQNAIAARNITISEDALPILKRIGRIETLNDLKNFADVVGLQEMVKHRESQEYRLLKGISGVDFNGNKIDDVGTWDGFCKACGYSGRSKVDEDIKYIQQYGYDRYIRLKEFIGYKGLRSLNYQSEEAKAEIGELVEKEDATKEDLLEKIEDLTAQHAKVKAELESKLKRKSEDYEAQAKLLDNKNKRIDQLDADLAQKAKLIDTMDPDTKGGELRKQTMPIIYNVRAILISQVQACFRSLTEHSGQSGIDHTQFMAGALLEIDIAIADLRHEFSLPSVLDGDPTPEWARDDAAVPDYDAEFNAKFNLKDH